MFPPISSQRDVCWKNEAQLSLFNRLRGDWKCDETFFQDHGLLILGEIKAKLHKNCDNSKRSLFQTSFKV